VTEYAEKIDRYAEKLRAGVEFYPMPIEKEDKVFYPASRKYLSEEEEKKKLDGFREFDRKMIYSKYRSVVEGLEKSTAE
jgi:hemerythrin-like domain-containing protein